MHLRPCKGKNVHAHVSDDRQEAQGDNLSLLRGLVSYRGIGNWNENEEFNVAV